MRYFTYREFSLRVTEVSYSKGRPATMYRKNGDPGDPAEPEEGEYDIDFVIKTQKYINGKMQDTEIIIPVPDEIYDMLINDDKFMEEAIDHSIESRESREDDRGER